MLNLPEILLLGSLPLLMVLSGFFSGCETALFSLTRHQRLRMSRSGGRAEAAVGTLLSETRGLLITLLVTNTTVNVVYFVVSTVLLIRLREHYEVPAGLLGVLSVVPVVGLILVGEVIPKLVASRLTVGWARVTSLPLMGVHRVLAPLRGLMSTVIITPLTRLIAPSNKPPQLTSQEIETLLELSLKRGIIDRDEERLMQEVLEISQLKVRQIMTPRVDVVAFDISDDPKALVAMIRETGRSHLPIYAENLDHIIGIIHARRVLLKRPATADELRRLISRVTYVPELQRADQLLVQFRKTGTTLAIAVDEYGGTAGLISLEDVVEEMVGQIAGPHEAIEDPLVESIGPGVWRVSAGLSIREWKDAFSGSGPGGAGGGLFASIHSEVHTIGGLVMAELGRLPRMGDRVSGGNVTIEVETMAERRVQWVIIRVGHPIEWEETSASRGSDQERK